MNLSGREDRDAMDRRQRKRGQELVCRAPWTEWQISDRINAAFRPCSDAVFVGS